MVSLLRLRLPIELKRQVRHMSGVLVIPICCWTKAPPRSSAALMHLRNGPRSMAK